MDLAQLRLAGINPNLIRLLAEQQEADQGVSGQAAQTPQAAPMPVESTQSPEGVASIKDIPAFTPEEEEGLIASVGRKALSGLQWVGESLDKPRRVVAGLVGGQPREMLNLIPFSDTLGITNPEQIVSGRDLLESVGLPENKPGIDVGDVAGFALEVATDPMNILTLGGSTVASKMLKEGAKTSKALTAGSQAKEIAEGLRPLVTLHTPNFGIPLPSKIPFTNIGIPRVALPVKDLASFGTGEKAANLYRAMNYGKYSPNPYVRKLFSASDQVREAPIKDQEAADLAWEAEIFADDLVKEHGVKLYSMQDDASRAVDELIDKTFFGENSKHSRAGLMADALKDTAPQSAELQSFIKARFGDSPNWDAIKADKRQLSEVEKLYGAIQKNQQDYVDLATDLKVKHEELLSSVLEAGKSADPLNAHWFDDTLRAFVERKDGLGLSDVAEGLKGAGLDGPGLDQAAAHVYALSDELRRLDKDMHSEMRRLGIDVGTLDDYYIGHAFRRPSMPEGTAAADFFKAREVKTNAPFLQSRGPVLSDLPGGTRTANDISRNPLFTAIKHNREGARAAWAKETASDFMPDISRAPQPGTYEEAVWNAAAENGLSYRTLKSFAMDVRNEAAQASVEMIKRKKEIHFLAGQRLGPDWRKTVNATVKADLDYTALDKKGFDEVAQMAAERYPGTTSDQVWEILQQHAKSAKVVKTHDEIAQEALMRYRSAEKATREAKAAAGDAADDFDTSMFESDIPSTLPSAAKLRAEMNAMKGPDHYLGGMKDGVYRPSSRVVALAKKYGVDTKQIDEALGIAGESSFDFNADMFDVTKDPTAYPNPSFGGKPLEWTAENAAFLMAKKYNLPAWWDHDKIIRNAIANGAINDPELIALAKDESVGHTTFKDKWWDMAKAKEADLPDDVEKWATDSVDAEDFTINAKAFIPELNRIPIKSQEDLLDLAKKMYHMPKAVLDDGLFNRGTVTDTVDYLIQATKLKSGVASLRSMLKSKGVLSASADGGSTKFYDAWKQAGLTDEGFQDFGKELFGELPPSDLVKKLDEMYVTPEIAKMMTGYVKVFKEPEQIHEALGWVDAFNGLFKGTLTIPYLAFHTRNRLSGVVANWVDGIYSAEAERKAQDLFFNKWDDAESEELLREIKVQNISAVGSGGASGQVNDQFDQFKGIGENEMPIGVSKNNAVNVARYVTNPFGELVADTRAAYQAGGVKKAAKQFFTGGKRADGSTAVDMNITGIKGGLDPVGTLGGSRAGRVDKFGRPVTGAEKWTAPETTNAWFQSGSNANNYVEWMNRVGPYIALRQAGWSPAMAARKVRQVQFDYRELSEIERRVFKRVMPFYSYMRKNLERQAKLLLANPGGRTAQMIRLENKAAREGKGEDGYVPKYLAESFAVRLPGGTERDQKFFSQSGLLPFEEAFNRFAFDDGLMPLNLQRTGEKFLAQAHPAIQAPLEYIAGKQFWSGRSLDDLYQTPTGDQDINLMLSKLPTSRLMGTVGGVFDDRKSIAEKAFNLAIGGAKITDVDPVKQRALETRDILEQTLASDPDIAKYTGLYANDLKALVERYNAGDQEAAKMLKLYQDIAAELRAMKKEQAAASSPQPRTP
jgi:2-oxo-4-hydroxy-4-carboxy--5-ureidoimidazoline (OHCU) decarboxylase